MTDGLGSVRAVGVTHAGGCTADRRRIGTSHLASAATISNAVARGHHGATTGSGSATERPVCDDDVRGNPAAAASEMKDRPAELDSVVGSGSAGAAIIVGATGAGAAAGTATVALAATDLARATWLGAERATGTTSEGCAIALGRTTGMTSGRCGIDLAVFADGGSSSST